MKNALDYLSRLLAQGYRWSLALRVTALRYNIDPLELSEEYNLQQCNGE